MCDDVVIGHGVKGTTAIIVFSIRKASHFTECS